MVTLGELFDELDYELEDMLDVLSQAIDLIEDGKVKEGVEVLKALEEDMFDFLDYVDVEEGEVDVILEEEAEDEKPAKAPKKAAKPAPKPAAKKAEKPKGKK
ncbi:MAG: hypothetical protein A4E32_01991 [Methanomassiliicoccales archaeon PtaU1.Bin124]|nr:MAG: hypothetical protein A4E32_01991 [Methanomassiliicoccales archaeon PtaU1.Bin124]